MFGIFVHLLFGLLLFEIGSYFIFTQEVSSKEQIGFDACLTKSKIYEQQASLGPESSRCL